MSAESATEKSNEQIFATKYKLYLPTDEELRAEIEREKLHLRLQLEKRWSGMRSRYKPIGDLIRLVDKRNTGLKIPTLLGLSISKEFIPSVKDISLSNNLSDTILGKIAKG